VRNVYAVHVLVTVYTRLEVTVVQGIYRVSGVKSQVELLCQSFETDEQAVDLSQHQPNVVANVLKFYFRQVCLFARPFKIYFVNFCFFSLSVSAVDEVTRFWFARQLALPLDKNSRAIPIYSPKKLQILSTVTFSDI